MAGFATGMSTHADMFLKIDGVEGESPDGKHKGEIELLSFSYGATQPGSAGHGGGSGIGKVQVQDFHFSKYLDKASPKLFEFCATGKHTPKVVLTCRKAGGDSLPTESVTLNFSKIEIEYKGQDEKGNLTGVVKAGWDLSKNQKV